MFNIQISEGVANNALKIIFEDGVKFSFSMNFWEVSLKHYINVEPG